MLTVCDVVGTPMAPGDVALADGAKTCSTRGGFRCFPLTKLLRRIYVAFSFGRLSPQSPRRRQLACAASEPCNLFIANDDRLSRLIAPGIHFIAPLDRAIM
jgi:hypothetical protein